MARAGFVYIWRDNKRGMFYISSHLGLIDDGYICSSKRMKRAHRLRQRDFKRRILFISKSITIKELHIHEQHWLDMIKECELNKRYYNAKKFAAGGGHNKKHSKETKQRMTGRKISAIALRNLSLSHKGQIPWNKGLTKASDPRINKIAKNMKRYAKKYRKGISYDDRYGIEKAQQIKKVLAESTTNIWKLRGG